MTVLTAPTQKLGQPEQSCDHVRFDSISVLKILSTPNSKWSQPVVICLDLINYSAILQSTHKQIFKEYFLLLNLKGLN